jgi:uncharacterized protein (DUF1697 family)
LTASRRQVAFLRGINVGRHNRIAMPALRALVTDLGYDDVTTLLQSGNVLFTASDTPAEAATAIAAAITTTLGLDVPVVARSCQELALTVANDPLGEVAHDPARYLIVFLDREPTKAALDRLATFESGGERFAVVGRDLYAWMPDGIHQSRLGSALGRGVLEVTWTGRNWNTVSKLLRLLDT